MKTVLKVNGKLFSVTEIQLEPEKSVELDKV